MKSIINGLSFACLVMPTAILAKNSPNSHLQQAQKLVTAAIERFEQTDRTQWAYKVNRYENEEGEITSSIERYSPHLTTNQQWTLERINGELPTDKQQRKFRADKLEKQKGKENAKSFSIQLSKLVQVDTLRMTDDTQDTINMTFDVELEKLGEDAQNKLKGHLVYDKKDEYVTSITIVNTVPFSPMFSAEIESFELNILFTEITETVLPLEQNLNMKGTFAIFKEINETSRDTFSEFRNVSSLASN